MTYKIVAKDGIKVYQEFWPTRLLAEENARRLSKTLKGLPVNLYLIQEVLVNTVSCTPVPEKPVVEKEVIDGEMFEAIRKIQKEEKERNAAT